LAGGTALAMHLNHRVSYDFDIFTEEQIGERFLIKVRDLFWEYEVVPMVDSRDQLSVTISGDVNLTWLYFPFTRMEDVIKTDSLPLFSLSDLLANKAYAIGRKKTWRDYADLYWCLKNKVIDLDKLVEVSEQKFRGVFAEKLFFEQLVYFDDVEEKTVEWIGDGTKNNEIKRWLEKEVKRYLGD